MTLVSRIPNGYDEAAGILGRLDERGLGYETRLQRCGDVLELRHHATAIVRFYRDGSVAVTTGGHYSPTTKERINAALSSSTWSVYSKRGQWYWNRRGSGQFCEYEDGDRVFLCPGLPGQDGIFEDLETETPCAEPPNAAKRVGLWRE